MAEGYKVLAHVLRYVVPFGYEGEFAEVVNCVNENDDWIKVVADKKVSKTEFDLYNYVRDEYLFDEKDSIYKVGYKWKLNEEDLEDVNNIRFYSLGISKSANENSFCFELGISNVELYLFRNNIGFFTYGIQITDSQNLNSEKLKEFQNKIKELVHKDSMLWKKETIQKKDCIYEYKESDYCVFLDSEKCGFVENNDEGKEVYYVPFSITKWMSEKLAIINKINWIAPRETSFKTWNNNCVNDLAKFVNPKLEESKLEGQKKSFNNKVESFNSSFEDYRQKLNDALKKITEWEKLEVFKPSEINVYDAINQIKGFVESEYKWIELSNQINNLEQETDNLIKEIEKVTDSEDAKEKWGEFIEQTNKFKEKEQKLSNDISIISNREETNKLVSLDKLIVKEREENNLLSDDKELDIAKINKDIKKAQRTYRKLIEFNESLKEYLEVISGLWRKKVVVKLIELHKKIVNNKECETHPDKALLFSYVVIDANIVNFNKIVLSDIADLTWHFAKGYKNSYHFNTAEENNMYRPFGDAMMYAAQEGMSYVVWPTDNTQQYLEDVWKSMQDEYFSLYIKVLYQSYSLLYFSELLQKDVPADQNNSQLLEKVENLMLRVNIFLAKSMATSVSFIHHHNDFYNYLKERLRIHADVKSLNAGLESLEAMARKNVEQAEAEREKQLTAGVGLLAVLGVLSALTDGSEFIKNFSEYVRPEFSGYVKNLYALIGTICCFFLFYLLSAIREAHKKNPREIIKLIGCFCIAAIFIRFLLQMIR